MGMTRTNDPYFEWLCRKVKIGAQYGKPYVKLARELHSYKYDTRDMLPMDENRAYDGLELRVIFMNQYGEVGSSTNRGACTMLEFLVGLAGRMNFLMGDENTESKRPYYFFSMIRNLMLLKFSDERFEEANGEFFVRDAVERILHRNYDRDGSGGLFPLRNPEAGDQRKKEIWYQMQAWLSEHCAIDIE